MGLGCENSRVDAHVEQRKTIRNKADCQQNQETMLFGEK
jgi:hypothetical protein